MNPIVADRDAQSEPLLVGTWQDSTGSERATITAEGAAGYTVVYRDTDGKTGRFRGRLGHIGTLRALDLEPAEPPGDLSDLYKGLLLPLHAPIILESIGATLQFRFLEGDSIKALLARSPGQAAHLDRDEGAILTGSTPEVQRFLAAMARRPGVLGELNVWRRHQP